ncbi:hypothetical protein BJ165DRAFT_1409884 [Panaeolus papilionaceus]|nr:hypothetical protein BJ165DRAFT_1409884 [Panaeolus papilionaceus]
MSSGDESTGNGEDLSDDDETKQTEDDVEDLGKSQYNNGKDWCKGGMDENKTLIGSNGSPTPYTLQYSIPYTQMKDIDMTTEENWEMFIGEVCKCPTPHRKLAVFEREVPKDGGVGLMDDKGNDESNNNDDDKGSRRQRKKKKSKSGPNDEETRQDKIIVHLTAMYMCEDCKRPFHGPCWVSATDVEHEGGIDGVNDNHPLTGKLFDPTNANSNADVSAMAVRHQGASLSSNSTTGSNVYVSFDGLADLLCGSVSGSGSNSGSGSHCASSLAPTAPTTNAQAKCPKMALAKFCKVYDVPDQIHEKLALISVQGPHALSFIKDEDLCPPHGDLLVGELGMLQDAELHWKFAWDNNPWDD